MNGFGGIFVDNLQDSKPALGASYNQMVDGIQKFERVHLCSFENIQTSALKLFCYFKLSLNEKENVLKMARNGSTKCQKIIFETARINIAKYDIIIEGAEVFQQLKNYYLQPDENLTTPDLILTTHFHSDLLIKLNDTQGKGRSICCHVGTAH